MIKYCEDCKHAKEIFNGTLVCTLAPLGQVRRVYKHCDIARNDAYGDCGETGKLFEQKVTLIGRIINVVLKKEK